MHIDVITLFPEMFSALTDCGITSRACDRGLLTLTTWNPRDDAVDLHRTVDDRPYGGGPGMVMKVQPLRDCLHRAKAQAVPADQPPRTIYLSPQGRVFDQAAAQILATEQHLIFIAGRYEGVDERFIDSEVDEEWSIGDYVLSGGELAAMVILDAVIRLLPGALGDDQSAVQDSFSDGLLDCPHYTRPEVIADQAVPEVLLSGDHEAIRRWRLQQSLGRTWLKRPDLLSCRLLTAEQQNLLNDFIRHYENT